MKPRAVARSEWRDGGRPLVVLRSFAESARSSLFALPVVWIAAATGLSQLVTWIDVRTQNSDAIPSFLDTTVESARAILGAISSGTIGAASVVFSLTLVAIQMSSSAYTSRVLRSFLRDRFQQHMIGIVLATFTYSLLVLREVRGPLEANAADSAPYIPRISVFLAVIFAIVSVLALLASISHTSGSLRASSVTHDLVTELVELIERTLPERADTADDHDDHDDDGNGGDSVLAGSATDATTTGAMATDRAGPGTSGSWDEADTHDGSTGAVLTSARRGWVQQVSLEAIRDSIESGTSVRLHVSAGNYVAIGSPLLTVWPPPSDDHVADQMHRLLGAFAIGEQRSLQQDIAFGFIMIEDIANKALSPGVNDPNTATAVIEQLGEPVIAILEREPHALSLDLDGCRVTRASVANYDDIVVAAFNQIRHFSVGQPAVQLVMVRTLIGVGDELIRRRKETDEALDAVRSMLRLVEADLEPAAADPTADAAHAALAQVAWYVPARTTIISPT